MAGYFRSGIVMLLFILCGFAQAEDSEDLAELDLAQRTLRGVLTLYQRHGFEVVYSQSLIEPRMVVLVNPPQGEPLQRLRNLLSHFGLQIEAPAGSRTLYLVPLPDWQPTVAIVLRDNYSNAPIASAELMAQGKVLARSNNEGVITLPLQPSDRSVLLVRHRDYVSQKFTPDGRDQLTLQMEPHPAIEEVVVTASTYQFHTGASSSVEYFSETSLAELPVHAGDPIQVTQMIPGVASMGLSAKPHIRGGAQDEVAIYFDGVELYDPFHLKDFQSLLSGIDSAWINSMSIYTGAYPARYGSRMSGVIAIEPKNTLGPFKHQLEFNALTTSAIGSGELGTTADWLLAARRGNLDEVLDAINPNIGTPRFNDLFARARWDLNSTAQLSAGMLALNDAIRLTDERETASSRYESRYLWVSADTDSTSDSAPRSHWQLALGEVRNEREGTRDDAADPSGSSGFLADSRDIEFWRLEGAWSAMLKRHRSVELGGRLEQARAYYDYQSQVSGNELAELLGQADRQIRVAQALKDTYLEFYSSVKERFRNGLTLEPGINVTAQIHDGHISQQWSPRIASELQLTSELVLKLSAGRFHQVSKIHELAVEQGRDELFPAQKSDHYVAGIEYTPRDALTLDVEVHRKNVFRPKPRMENLFDPYRLLPELAPDAVILDPTSARIQGVEVTLRWNPEARWNTWLNYASTAAREKIDGALYDRRWSEPHAVGGGMSFHSGPWIFSSAMHWHSGWRTSAFDRDQVSTSDAPEVLLNSEKLPSYFSLDLKAAYEIKKSDYSFNLFAQISNITNHQNIGSRPLTLTLQNDDSFVLQRGRRTLMPILPILGITWQF